MNKKDYAKMKYNFHALKKDESIFDLGDLSPFKSVFSEQTQEEQDLGLDPEFVMKYIILMNSIGSPFIEKYTRLGQRKTEVMKELGIEPDSDNTFPAQYDIMLRSQIPAVVRKISVFRTLQKPTDFAIMLSAEEELHNLLAPSAQGEEVNDLTMSDSLKKRQLVNLLREQYDEAGQRLMDFNTDMLEQLDLQKFVAQSSLGIRQEETLSLIAGLGLVTPKNMKAGMLFKQAGN